MDELEKIKKEKTRKLIEKIKGDKMQTEIDVNDSNFKEKVIEQSATIPVVVDFWASWCMPCRMISPILEKLAKDYDGKFILAKADVEETKATAQEYSVMSIPNVKLFKNGEIAAEFVGALPESAVKGWLDENI